MSNPQKDALAKQAWLLHEYMTPLSDLFLEDLFTNELLTKQELDDIKVWSCKLFNIHKDNR